MKRTVLVLAVSALLLAACSGDGGTPPAGSSSDDAAVRAADAELVLAMYDEINVAFQREPNAGVRAIIDYQYPGDLVDVDFERCVKAIAPGATTLPMDKRLTFKPNIATMTPDPGYVVTSNRVTGLKPEGRIYVTDVMITDGGRPTLHERHQVVLDGKAYQFSAC